MRNTCNPLRNIIKDELTQTVVGAIEPELSKAEQERARLKKPENLDVWGIYLRGMAALTELTRESLAEAGRTFSQVTERDPGFAAAHAGLAEVHYYNLVLGFVEDPGTARAAALDAARRAVEHDRDDARAHCTLGRAHLVNRKFDDAVSEFQTALEINPSHALIRVLVAMVGKAGATDALEDAAHLLLDQARILEGEPLPEPGMFSKRLADLLTRSLET